MKVSEIEWSVRIYQCLDMAGYLNLDIKEFLILKDYDFLRLRNFGRSSLIKMKAILEENKLHFLRPEEIRANKAIIAYMESGDDSLIKEFYSSLPKIHKASTS